ncbi:ATP-binding protein [Teredinibacter sp. KSP-S5-2]|uniref:ATP-binding protein n=1 Tax=Teredinibacter sp. KSP-S5-2 TaxID=3034506 RepID=UPI002934A0F8|nr:ATP-binding protein [Teredinibacter sp. KSP-S5-2]WNO08225.1 ATP-binding protein [Teredinibacter sp. KSP-S5-2]
MLKSIKFKLWLTFLTTLLLSMLSMLLLTHASVKKGFLDYVTEQAIEQLVTLETTILEIYGKQGSFQPLENNIPLWRKLKYNTFRKYVAQQRLSENGNANPTPPEIKAHQKAFIDQLILTDAHKNLIVGRPVREQDYSWLPLNLEGTIIGYIGYVKPTDFLRSVDRLFVQQQLRAFVVISIGLIFFSFIVALVVSRWLTKPLSILSQSAKKLASGDFTIRIKNKSHDELGELCTNFNELAHTLSANEAARKQWVADISHEMRTPLAVVKAQIEAMQDGIRETSDKNLGILKEKIDSLNFLINDLYELSLSDLGALSYDKEPLFAQEIINQIADDFSERIAVAGHSFAVRNNLHPKDKIFGDRERIFQLFYNLLENSTRYTDSPGTISLTASRTNGTIIIYVEDSSPSVPKEQLGEIFNRLYRVEGSRNRETGGAGLGLSICSNIVDAHQGEIHAESSYLGGLRVCVSLPASKIK